MGQGAFWGVRQGLHKEHGLRFWGMGSAMFRCSKQVSYHFSSKKLEPKVGCCLKLCRRP